jgi:hypothetical protein
MREGIWAPRIPKLIRLMTGNGTPVFSPMNPDRVSSTNRNPAPTMIAARICQVPSPRANSPIANA